MTNKFYITTPIYYVNASPHIGHAYTTLAADIIARFYRQENREVFFLTGTDEHGAKIVRAAIPADVINHFPKGSLRVSRDDKNLIKQFTDKISQEFKDAWKELDIKYDYFIRTTDKNHEKFVSDFLQKLYDKGDIYEGIYEGLYCVGCEEYKKFEDLIDGKCPLHKTRVEKIQEKVYFFKLSKYQDEIIELIQTDKIEILPTNRKNEVLGFLKQKIEDTAISRSQVEWGIPVPWDPSQTIYVWVDALLNYLSAVNNSRILEFSNSQLSELWPPDLQLIGKDILRFHAVIWPGLLLSAEYDLPKKIFVHGFFTVNGQKMSKSLNNVITSSELIERYGVDATRYLLISAYPFGNDGDFSIAELDKKYNADLSNGLGNLVQRAIVLAQKFKVEFIEKKLSASVELNDYFENVNFTEAINFIKKNINNANKFVNDTKPWETGDKYIIAELLQKIAQIAIDLKPFIPSTCERILAQLKTRKPEILFPKII
ncbi:MAG: methionyl-tRNA synthetase [Candidatus Berkelbacteria bacterium Licking1014_85]|uniref:Methionine--tRNA ligase n=1 Tax=Candidatus Berkelbacteria bacterium Licking1014_85 TaxID=2017148 RepID=A0A554LI46_9BACT|nr:MAG: methionyl-tRNA synthetase [Candidatus Berkelbacteria bacterium Licking1014_85]